MSDEVFAPKVPQSILQLHQLNKDVVFRIQAGRGHRRFEIEREPFLHTFHAGALRQVKEQGQIKNNGRREDRVATEKIDLDLHLVAEPAEDVDVVPTFFVVAARRVVVDAHDGRTIFVELRVNFRLKDVL